MKKIFITGCARSGTTLLARLFYAFEKTYVIEEEISLKDFAGNTDTGNYNLMIGKRTEHTIFSNILSDSEKQHQLDLIDQHDIVIINCVRDGRDVVHAWQKNWGVYNPSIWAIAVRDFFKHRKKVDIQIRYEDILSNPNKVQKRLEAHLDCKSINEFSSYPSFVPSNSFKTEDENYIPRPIEAPPKEAHLTYLRPPNDIRYFEETLRMLKYNVRNSDY